MRTQLTVQDLITYLDAVQRASGGDTPIWLYEDGAIALVLSGPFERPTAAELAAARAHDALDGALQCVQCGCTDHVGCPEGCWWITRNPPLCSTCIEEPPAPQPRESHAQRVWSADRQRLLR